MVPPSFNQVVVELDALVHNYNVLRDMAGKAEFLAMVKADGYGHGMVECARALQRSGCLRFGVAELGEAVALRQSGIAGEIFAMVGFDMGEADYFTRYDITPVVYDTPSIQALSKVAVQAKKDIPVHVKVETGMNRLGIQLDEFDELLSSIDKLPGIYLGGIASHFPSADDRSSPSTRQGNERFDTFRKRIKDRNVVCHIANSGGTLYYPPARADMVRCGISLYGYYPGGLEADEENALRPVMSFSTPVLAVKDISVGSGVSYGHTFVAERPTTLAILPVGYEDGFSRKLSNCGEVLIRGCRAPVRGRVCMNLTMVDVTEIEGVVPGDEAVILGRQGNEEITADEIALRIETISYEVLCMIGNNNERTYKE